MLETSQAYNDEMLKTYRQPTTAKVVIGVVEEETKSGDITPPDLLVAQNTEYMTDATTPVEQLCTWESQRFTADGEQKFIADGNLVEHRYGFISKQLVDINGDFRSDSIPELTVSWSKILELYGFSLVFDTKYGAVAKQIQVQAIVNSEVIETKTITNTNKDVIWTCIVGFDKCDSIKIKFLSLYNPGQHLHLERMVIGVSVEFNSDEITDTSLNVTTDPLSGQLPEYNFTLSLNNLYNKFNFEDPDNFIWFVKNRQKVQVTYYQTLEDQSKEELDGGSYIINASPTVNETIAEIYAGSILDYLDFVIETFQFPDNPVTLYDYLTQIEEKANERYMPPGISLHFQLDSSLKNITTSAPLPYLELREVIQYIANAALCSIKVQKDSTVTFRTANIPEATLTSAGGSKYSKDTGILEGEVPWGNYAVWAYHAFKVNGQDWLDAGTAPASDYHQVGYVSEEVSDSNGNFTNKPVFTIVFSGTATVSNLKIVTDVTYITSMLIEGYLDNELTFSTTVTPNSQEYILGATIYDVDKIVITVNSININNAPLRVKEIDVDNRAAYTLIRGNTSGEPETTLLSTLRAVQVQVYSYSKRNTVEEIISQNITVPPQSNISAIYTFTEPGVVTNVTSNNPGVTVTYNNSGAYSVNVQLQNSSNAASSAKLTISGYKIDVSSYTYEYFIQQNGSVEVIDNPLVTTEEHAKQLAQWVADFAAYPKQYTVPYRGDPSVEPMDFIKYETRDRTTPITLVTGYTLNVGQGMDGSFTLKEVKER